MLKRRKGLRRVSKKRSALNVERRAFVVEQLTKRPICEAGTTIGQHLRDTVTKHLVGEGGVLIWVFPWRWCTVVSTQVHEPLSRARGGSIVDVDNSLCVCAACHHWITTHPREATELGLLKSAYGQADAG